MFTASNRSPAVATAMTVEDVVAATGFELAIDGDVPESRVPDHDEIRLIRDVIDPDGLGEKEVANS